MGMDGQRVGGESVYIRAADRIGEGVEQRRGYDIYWEDKDL
jgi:hypothetical protein